jgi:hypothetical protein
MIRRILLVGSLGLLTAISIPILGSADDLEPEPSDGRGQQSESEQPEGREEWREQLLIANQELAIAVGRSADALRAYRDMRQRRRPRGDAKQAIMDEVELSREELTRTQQNLESLEKAARRAGAPPSWLKFDPAEIKAATQVPASQQP